MNDVAEDCIVTRSDAGVTINAAAALALELDKTTQPVPLQTFATLGPVLGSEDGELRCGAWLLQLIDRAGDAVLGRAVADSRLYIDAFASHSQARVRVTERPPSGQFSRHDLNNWMNNIKVNAELIRILAAAQQSGKIEAAAQRILNECSRTTAAAQGRRDTDIEPSAQSYPTTDALQTLLWASASADEELTLQVWGTDTLPTALLLQISHFLNRLARAANVRLQCRPLALQPEPAVDLWLALDTPGARNTLACELEREWQVRESNPAALANLDRSIKSYRVTADGSRLVLEIAVRG